MELRGQRARTGWVWLGHKNRTEGRRESQRALSSIPPQLSSLQHCKCVARILILCCWGTLRLCAAGKFFGWQVQGYLVAGHCRDTLQLGTAGMLCSWALQGYFAVGQCEDTQWLRTAGILYGWALQRYLMVRHCRDTWWLVTKVSQGTFAAEGMLLFCLSFSASRFLLEWKSVEKELR